jgi:predicted nucleotidyltransferase
MNFDKKLWEEFVRDVKNVDISTLAPKSELNAALWDENRLKPEISRELLEIAQNFFENLDLDVEMDDITLTGSSASYNWSKYSDIDLHILVDFKKVDENTDLVREFFRGKVFVWNQKHKIEIFGHEVEIYVQDNKEPHHSLGVYSIKNNEWTSQPTKADLKIDFQAVKKKALMLMDCIDRVYDLFEDQKYKISQECGQKIKEKIKNMRKSGLEGAGIYSIENLSFKVLRRNGYLADLNTIIDRSYDYMHSLTHNFLKKLKIYVSGAKNDAKSGFHALNELEKYQKRVKRRHSRMKNRLIGRGNQSNEPPFTRKPSDERAKSAPPDAGGT